MTFIASPTRWTIQITCGETYKTIMEGYGGSCYGGELLPIFSVSITLFVLLWVSFLTWLPSLFLNLLLFFPFANSIYIYTQGHHERIVSFCYSPKWGCLIVLVFKGRMISSFDVLLEKLEISWQRYLTPLGSFFMGQSIVLCLTQLNRPKSELYSVAPLLHINVTLLLLLNP